MAETRLDPNLVALLMNRIQNRVGMNGQQQMPQFTGGGGMDPNLGALLVAGGQIPKRLDMQGRVMLPGAQQGGAGGLDGQTFEGLDNMPKARGIPGAAFAPDGGAFGRVQEPTQQYAPVASDYEPARPGKPGGGMAPYVPPTQPQAPAGPDYRAMYQPMAGGADLYARLATQMRSAPPPQQLPTMPEARPGLPPAGAGLSRPAQSPQLFPPPPSGPAPQMVTDTFNPRGPAPQKVNENMDFLQRPQMPQGPQQYDASPFGAGPPANNWSETNPTMLDPFWRNMEERGKRPLGNPLDLFKHMKLPDIRFGNRSMTR